jgi:hypothetical protein
MGLGEVILTVPPVADAICSFLTMRDIYRLSLTCLSLRRQLSPLYGLLARKSVARVVDDFDRFRSILRATNSYIELDDRCHAQLWHPFGLYAAQGIARHLYVGGPHVKWKVLLLFEYFVLELGYDVQYEFFGKVCNTFYSLMCTDKMVSAAYIHR